MDIDVNEFCDIFEQIDTNKYPPQNNVYYLTGLHGDKIPLSSQDEIIRALDNAINEKNYRLAKAINQHLAYWEIKNKKVIYKHLPLLIHAELSSFCNCECIMCTHCYEKNDRAKYLDIKVIEKFLPTCRLMVINGIGELFIHPKIIEILSKLREYHVQLSVTTNAQYIPTDALPLIGDVFTRICVSCDGATKDTYERIRRGASFEVFKSNCKLLRSALHNDSMFTMSVVSMKQNLLETVELVRLAKKLGFDEIRFGRLSTNSFIGNENDSINKYPNLTTKIMSEALKEGANLGIKVIVPVIYENEIYSVPEAEKEKKELLSSIIFKDTDFYEKLHIKYKELYKDGFFKPDDYSLDGVFKCNGICHWLAYGININSDSQIRPCGEIVRQKNVDNDEDLKLNNLMNNSESVQLRRVFLMGQIPNCCVNCSYLMGHENELLTLDTHEFRKIFI